MTALHKNHDAVTKLMSCCRDTPAKRLGQLAALTERFTTKGSDTVQIGKSESQFRYSRPVSQSTTSVGKFLSFHHGSGKFQEKSLGRGIAGSNIDLEMKEPVFKTKTISLPRLTAQINRLVKSFLDTPEPSKDRAVRKWRAMWI